MARMVRVDARGRARRLAATVLVVVGAVFLLFGGVLLYARQEVFKSQAFADHATHTLDNENVRVAVADAVLDQVTVGSGAQLLSFRPALGVVLNGVVMSDPFRAVFHRAAGHTHDVLFERRRGQVILDLADAGLAVSGAAKAVSPDLARHIPKDIKPGLLALTKRDWATQLLDIADSVRVLGLVLPVLALLCFAGAVAAAVDRRLIFIRVGGAIAVAAAITLIGLFIGRSVLLADFGGDTDALRGAVGAAWDAFLGGLHTWALVVGAFGLIVAAAASSVVGTVDAAAPIRRLGAFVTRPPATTAGRVLRALAITAAGLLVVLEPQWAIETVVTAVGGYAIFFACTEILRVIEPAPAGDGGARGRGSGHGRALIIAGATPVVVILLAVIAFALSTSTGSASTRGDPHPKACNGFAQLCDRPLNQVAFAATHNAMSAARYRGWLFANQHGRLTDQLNAGIRGLLIDTHYGYRSTGGLEVVRTALKAEGRDLNDVTAEIGKSATEAALRVTSRVGGKPTGRPQPFLCHAMCELGDIPLVTGLGEIRRFIQGHPDEVLVVFVEDRVSAGDTAAAFAKAGLLRYVFTHGREDQWPTLRQMIRSNRRVFVMYENGPGDPRYPWYHNGFELTQETPYSFHSESQLSSPASCRPNRGTPASPLFQVNNWIDEVPPPPDSGPKSNAFPTLLKRLRRCQRLRGLLPNIVGVDFYDQGDVVGAVNELNGLPRKAKPTVRVR